MWVPRAHVLTMAKDVSKITWGLIMCALMMVFAIFLTSSTGGAEIVQESTTEVGQAKVSEKYQSLPASIEAKRDVSRTDFAGNEVSKEFCGGPTYYHQKKCSQEYEESMVMTALPLMIMALLTLVIWLVLLIGRNCCTCCDTHRAGLFGGRYPTKGCCLGELKGPDEGYTICENRLFLFLVISVLVLVFAGLIVGSIGNDQVSKGVSNLLDTTAAMPSKLSGKVSLIQTELNTLEALGKQVNPYLQHTMWQQIRDALVQVNKGAESMQGQVGDSLTVIRKYESDRSAYLYCGLVIPTILAFLALLGYLCPALLTVVVLPLAVVTTIILWVAVGVHVPVSVSTADFCVGLDYGLKHPNASSPLDILVGCHAETGAKKMADSAKYFEETSAHVACSTLNTTLCNKPPVKYPDKHGNIKTFLPVTCPQMQCSSATLGAFVKKTVVRDFEWGCAALEKGNIVTHDCRFNDKNEAQSHCLSKFGNTDTMPCVPGTHSPYRQVSLAQCNSTCLINTTMASSTTVVGNDELARRFRQLDEQQLRPLVDCSFIRQQATQVEHVLCWDVVDGTDYVIAGLCIIGITFFMGTFLYLAAYKRFHRSYLEHTNKWPGEREKILRKLGIDPQDSQTTALLGAGSKPVGNEETEEKV